MRGLKWLKSMTFRVLKIARVEEGPLLAASPVFGPMLCRMQLGKGFACTG